MQNGTNHPTHKDANRCLHTKDNGHGERYGEYHGIRGIDNGAFPQNNTGRSYQSNGGGVDSLQNGLEGGIVTKASPKRDHGKNQNNTRTKQSQKANQSSGNSLVDRTKIRGKVEQGTGHGLSQTQSLQELILGHPIGHHFILQHGQYHLTSPENNGTNAVHGFKNFQVHIGDFGDIHQNNDQGQNTAPHQKDQGTDPQRNTNAFESGIVIAIPTLGGTFGIGRKGIGSFGINVGGQSP
mmetsp:Transcript_25135/g.52257  ORF Transcript_25135/g.52257 Transcript_25135/m.52257 type:complete len:238 (-) Transcript_25135:772-1485(-)